MINREIQTLTRLNHLLEQYGQTELEEDGIPTVIDYGSIAMTNFTHKWGIHSERMCYYYIMPLYEINFKQYCRYLNRKPQVEKLDKIIDVTS